MRAIRENFEALQERLQHQEEQCQARHSALSSSVEALRVEVRDGYSAITARLDDEVTATERTDARGLGPVAFGFVMVAVPNQLAYFSLVGAFFTATALFITGAAVQTVFMSGVGS